MNVLIQTILDRRGYTRDYLMDINNDAHDNLIDIDVICEKLYEIKQENKVITILPDFDADGIMSGIVGFAGLAELGFAVNLFIPNPDRGYGFGAKTIDRLMSDYPNTQVIITCDVGITCFDGIDRAKELGVSVLLTDHHLQFAKNNADVTVNPNRIDETYRHPEICGAYVLYQVLMHYAKTYCNSFVEEQIRRLCVFAGIGTVSDLMPVLYENRQLVRDSISISRLVYGDGDDSMVSYIPGCDTYRRAFYGLHVFYKMMADYGKIRQRNDIDETFYSYYFAPMLNSVKRMNGDMKQVFGIFFGHNPAASVDYVFNLNNERKILSGEYFAKIKADTTQKYAPYVYVTDAYKGLLGLIANNFMAECPYLPCMCVNKHADGSFSGSGRSPEFYPLLSRVRGKYQFAGHDHAFGITFKNEQQITEFIEFVKEDIKNFIPQIDETSEDEEEYFDFVIGDDDSCDTGIDIDLFEDYAEELKYYKPFGKSFPVPKLKLKFAKKDAEFSVMGSTKQHLRAVLPYGFVFISWNNADDIHAVEKMSPDDIIEVVGNIKKNVYNDKVTMQFVGNIIFDRGDI